MNYYYITGTSKGLGKALALLLLEHDNNFVYGLSRTQSINHERYNHINFDLAKINEVKNFKFTLHDDSDLICLINNASIIGMIKRLGEWDNDIIEETVNVNITSLFILINNFIKFYKNSPGRKLIINISSGAGSHAVDAWSVYCASKAAMNMMSEVVQKEFDVTGRKDFKILSVPPGVID